MSAIDPYADIDTVLTRSVITKSVREGLIVNDMGPDGEPLHVSAHSESASASLFDETDVDARISARDLVDALTELSLGSGDPAHPAGLVIRKTVIEGGLHLDWLTLDFPLRFDGCVFTGWVSLDYATLKDLSFSQCAFEVIEGHYPFGAVNGLSVSVKNRLDFFGVRGLKQLFIVESTVGELSLSADAFADIAESGYQFRTVLDGTSIERLRVDAEQLSASPRLESLPLGAPSRLVVGSLESVSSHDDKHSVDPRRIAKWIMAGSTGDPRRTSYSRQVWEAFAQALDRDSMDSEATALRVLGRKFGRSKRDNPFAKAWDWLLWATIGYGYANSRAFLIWLGLLAFTITTVAISSAAGFLSYPGQSLDNVAAILLYSLTVVLSPVGTGGPQDWFFTGAPVVLALILSAFKIASLVLLGLFVSGLSGIVSRR
ncbi:hypothetical protein QYR02_12620 [Microbacterium maritypicum]|uniref:hypothetical protein n=1 Tax=Microbacterium maritypicum TaxID=33918 RepID=UPI002673A3F7|nr:hypothetical protein [Microbacterium liquefaciens]WKT88288.1 hypothetical protein QYR02_12620 [Microbacterium liquefaciens]